MLPRQAKLMLGSNYDSFEKMSEKLNIMRTLKFDYDSFEKLSKSKKSYRVLQDMENKRCHLITFIFIKSFI